MMRLSGLLMNRMSCVRSAPNTKDLNSGFFFAFQLRPELGRYGEARKTRARATDDGATSRKTR